MIAKCIICYAEFEPRTHNELTCSDTCKRRNARFSSLRYYHERGGAEQRDDRKKKAVKPIKAVGEGWDGLALPPRVAKRLGL